MLSKRRNKGTGSDRKGHDFDNANQTNLANKAQVQATKAAIGTAQPRFKPAKPQLKPPKSTSISLGWFPQLMASPA
jgi:hypothetical protein